MGCSTYKIINLRYLREKRLGIALTVSCWPAFLIQIWVVWLSLPTEKEKFA